MHFIAWNKELNSPFWNAWWKGQATVFIPYIWITFKDKSLLGEDTYWIITKYTEYYSRYLTLWTAVIYVFWRMVELSKICRLFPTICSHHNSRPVLDLP